jgi:translation initiation factor 3 subunit G
LQGTNWADYDDDGSDAEVSPTAQAGGLNRFETAVDANGIKTVIEYKERDGRTYKVSKRVRVTKKTTWFNPEMGKRKQMEKFGKPSTEKMSDMPKGEECAIDVCKRAVMITQANDAEDKFLEEALKGCENLFKEKKVWTDLNRAKQEERDAGPEPPKPEEKPAAAAAEAPAAPGAPRKYVPPTIRAQEGKGGGKGDFDQQQEASLRVTNLSEDVKEGDLQELFRPFGRTQRVYLAKDPVTFLSKGFAFITYYDRADAGKAMKALNGHGYDNLIMQVQWAKPRA